MRLAQSGHSEEQRDAWNIVKAEARQAGTLDVFATVRDLTAECGRGAGLMWRDADGPRVTARAMAALSVRRNVTPRNLEVVDAPWKEQREPAVAAGGWPDRALCRLEAHDVCQPPISGQSCPVPCWSEWRVRV